MRGTGRCGIASIRVGKSLSDHLGLLTLVGTSADAALVEAVVQRHGVTAKPCDGAGALLVGMGRGALAAVVDEKLIDRESGAALRRWLAAQPAWADFPFIVLADPNEDVGGQPVHPLVAVLGNAVVLERPVRHETLSSAVAFALRSRRRQEEARRMWVARDNGERRMRIALMAANLGTWNIDLKDRSLSASPTLRAHFGRAPDATFTTRELFDALHPDDRERVRVAGRAALDQQADLNCEARVVWPDGTIRRLQLTGRTLFGDDGRPEVVSGVSLDVTLRHQSDQDLQLRVTTALAQTERAQAALAQAQKMEAVGQLTGGIAHDFNNLLTGIIGNLDLISRRTADPRVETMVERARGAAERAAKLTGQLLAFSRSQRLDLTTVGVDRLIDGMRELVARTIGPAVTVEVELGVAGEGAMADGNQLELAVLNLAINARDAMPSGGRLRLMTRAEQTVDEAGEHRWIVLAVCDDGAGIAPDVLPRIFDPFFTTKPVGKGTGLGLSQVHGIAHQSGGFVRVDSEVGRGTTIEIWLKASPDAPRELAASLSGDMPAGDGRILVVDDDADVRRFMVECLASLGYEVTQAESGRAGLARLALDAPDLLIVDFAMPDMNGAEVAAIARASRPDLPIVLATGYADTALVEATFARDAIVRKPFRIQDISRAVRHALGERS